MKLYSEKSSQFSTITLIGFCALLGFNMACSSRLVQQDGARDGSPTYVTTSNSNDDAETRLLDLDINDVPQEYRYLVVKWLDYYQGRGRQHMERYLSRSTRYLPLMKETLKSNGLPEDLVYIPLIESGFNARARSRAGAVGYWQFIRGTGRRYGLAMNHMVDERQDPLRSTEAAAMYLKGLYNLFGSWYLAIASYNVGENRVKNMVMKHYTRSFWELAHRRVLPGETVDYVPKFIAACMIARDPEKYGFTDIAFKNPLSFYVLQVDRAIDIQKFAHLIDVPYQELKDLNPLYRTRAAVPVRGSNVYIRVPKNKRDVAIANVEKAYTKVTARLIAAEGGVYRVRRGDTLSGIAKKFRTTVNALRRENDISRGSVLRIGLLLKVPGERSSARNRKPSSIVRKSHRTKHAYRHKKRYHRIRRGETLTEIAHKYNVSIPALVQINRLARKGHIMAGHLLKIPTVMND